MAPVTGNRTPPGEGYETERVEVRPGHFIKMSPADRKAWEASRAEQAPEAPIERAVSDTVETATSPAHQPKAATSRKAKA